MRVSESAPPRSSTRSISRRENRFRFSRELPPPSRSGPLQVLWHRRESMGGRASRRCAELRHRVEPLRRCESMHPGASPRAVSRRALSPNASPSVNLLENRPQAREAGPDVGSENGAARDAHGRSLS